MKYQFCFVLFSHKDELENEIKIPFPKPNPHLNFKIFWSVKLKFCERTISHPIQFRGNQEIKSTYEK